MKHHLFLLLLLTSVVRAEPKAEPLSVSLVNLIATPEAYEGKMIELTGFSSLEFEGNAVYFSEQDYRYGVWKNSISLSFKSKPDNLWLCHNEYCRILGIFSKTTPSSAGPHEGRRSGFLSVQEIELQSDKSKGDMYQ